MGRVKTLHPKIHGGILARRDLDAETLAEHGIVGIDLVAVNLYPFEQTIARPDCTLALAVENIDIGGPGDAARRGEEPIATCSPLPDPADYAETARRLREDRADMDFRRRLAAKAFAHTAAYDRAVAGYLAEAAS